MILTWLSLTNQKDQQFAVKRKQYYNLIKVEKFGKSLQKMMLGSPIFKLMRIQHLVIFRDNCSRYKIFSSLSKLLLPEKQVCCQWCSLKIKIVDNHFNRNLPFVCNHDNHSSNFFTNGVRTSLQNQACG